MRKREEDRGRKNNTFMVTLTDTDTAAETQRHTGRRTNRYASNIKCEVLIQDIFRIREA